MKTQINNIIRCTGSYEQRPDEVMKRQPWQCVARVIDPVAEYNEFWQRKLDDNTGVNSWYDQRLEKSGVEAGMDEMIADNSAWEAKLAELDANWAVLDAQRAEENAQLIEQAKQTSLELAASLGNLAALKRQ